MNFRNVLIGILALTVIAAAPLLVQAKTTSPLEIVYNGHLLDSSGDAITTAHTIRFSLWNTSDYETGDVTATGALRTASSNYLDWYEEFTVTPNSDGYFSVQLGSGTSLPSFQDLSTANVTSLHLQVEVKASAAADTAYEMLDKDSSDEVIDREPLLSVPHALNADLLDQRDVGTGSGAIPHLGSGGSLLQAGTMADRFTIDSDGGSGSVVLRFGSQLGKELSYDNANNWFNFNDDVNIQGDLTISGLINGVDINSISAGSNFTHLKVQSGGTLKVDVAAGSYNLQGNVTNYNGASDIVVTDEATNYVFFGSGGITVSTVSFPDEESYIPLAEVTTTGGEISTVVDRRVLQTDNREKTVEKVFHAQYANASYQADATNNVGQMHVSHDNSNKRNFYQWTSSQDSLQDYDILVPITLPDDFVRWGSGALQVRYRSTSASTDDNQLDISVFDTNGTPVSLSGSSQDLANTSWATTTLNFSGSPTWTAGQDILIKFTMFSKDNEQMQLGKLRLEFIEFQQE